MNERLDFIDILSILSFVVGLENLEENISQSDVQDIAQEILQEIHTHLKEQDEKLDIIMRYIYDNN